MINHRGANMRRLIALLAAAVLIITILSSPVAATCPDPSKPVPWMDNYQNPESDDGGWNVPVSVGTRDDFEPHVNIGLSFLYIFQHKYLFIVVNKSVSSNKDDNTDQSEVRANTGAH
jgi:hypothetical protein